MGNTREREGGSVTRCGAIVSVISRGSEFQRALSVIIRQQHCPPMMGARGRKVRPEEDSR